MTNHTPHSKMICTHSRLRVTGAGRLCCPVANLLLCLDSWLEGAGAPISLIQFKRMRVAREAVRRLDMAVCPSCALNPERLVMCP